MFSWLRPRCPRYIRTLCKSKTFMYVFREEDIGISSLTVFFCLVDISLSRHPETWSRYATDLHAPSTTSTRNWFKCIFESLYNNYYYWYKFTLNLGAFPERREQTRHITTTLCVPYCYIIYKYGNIYNIFTTPLRLLMRFFFFFANYYLIYIVPYDI